MGYVTNQENDRQENNEPCRWKNIDTQRIGIE